MKMVNEKRMIDAMDTVVKISKAVTPLINAGCSDEWVCQKIYDKVLNCIADAPTVDAVEVVHGRWKAIPPVTPDGWRNSKTGEKVFPMCCSVCGDAYMNGPYNYCPNCGAKMDGGNEDV